jgi:hypothetical protein
MDYRPQWGNDGEVPINLGCYYTTQQSNGKAWFGKSFDLAQDRLTTGGSASPSQESQEPPHSRISSNAM